MEEESAPDIFDDSSGSEMSYKSSNNPTSLLIQSSASRIEDAYDKFLSKKGFSCYLITIIACSGIGLLSDTLEIMSISFAKEDMAKHFKLSRQEESTLAGALFAGMLIGGLIWGHAADIYGRRRVLLISLTMNGSCAALSAISPTFWMFLTSRFFSGIGVGGSLPVIFSYVSEWAPRKMKGGVISTVATCWMVGSVLASGLAWATLTLPFPSSNYLQAWRVYLLICSVPSLIAAGLYAFLDESPVFLMEKGRKQEAMIVLRKYAANDPNLSNELGVLKRFIEDKSVLVPETYNKWKICSIILDFIEGTVDLFSSPLRKTTLLLMAVILPVHFGYYGFMLWLPEYITAHSHDSGTIHSPEYVYKESLYISLASLPGNFITILITDKVGPKSILCVSQILSACSVFLLWKFNSPDQTIILMCVFNAVTTPIFNMVDLLIPALYPTQSRGTAFGFHSALIRIIMIASTWIFSLFIDTSPTAPILLTAILLVSSTFFSLFVPNIRKSLTD